MTTAGDRSPRKSLGSERICAQRNTEPPPSHLNMRASRTICTRRLEKTSVFWIASHTSWVLASWLLAAPFAAAAGAHLLPLKIFRDAGYPAGYRAVTGALLALAAVLMVIPEARLLGVGIAAFVMFLTATTLISRRQYTYAAPVVAVLFALVPVAISV
jgi:hypothetical protein